MFLYRYKFQRETSQFGMACHKEYHLNEVEYRLNIELSKINEWLKINTLPLSVRKSKSIIHKMGNKQVNNLLLKIYESPKC